MIYIETGSTDVCYDFALEYYFTLEKRLSDTVFLFWRTTPTLMVGKYQNVLEEVDKPYADAHGIRIVRRMSGGGTVYHDLGNVNYTIIKDAPPGGEVCYGDFLDSVVAALNRLQIPARRGRTSPWRGGRSPAAPSGFPAGGCCTTGRCCSRRIWSGWTV